MWLSREIQLCVIFRSHSLLLQAHSSRIKTWNRMRVCNNENMSLVFLAKKWDFNLHPCVHLKPGWNQQSNTYKNPTINFAWPWSEPKNYWQQQQDNISHQQFNRVWDEVMMDILFHQNVVSWFRFQIEDVHYSFDWNASKWCSIETQILNWKYLMRVAKNCGNLSAEELILIDPSVEEADKASVGSF